MRRRIIILVFLIIAVLFGYNYIYQDHRDIESEVTKFEVTTEDIASSFSDNVTVAETTYLNTTIEVSGKVSEYNNNSITLDDKVFCQFIDNIKHNIESNTEIKIKGRVIGYDDLLEQVKLDQCTIKKQ
ncbi:hypothetical protein [uncultured Psychroserpens sp.]|uniref:OB-fold protein n=1 Tax=uncultured Psychroserpens sp. TaxID=255436 RepID=UPI002639BD4E|nr:hypothetical protein [uncultured Psychroserpens sp.]